MSELDDDELERERQHNRRRFEYGTFFTSCTALLFLRLICRAIITPDDYGVLGGGLSESSSSGSGKKEDGEEGEVLLSMRGFPAIYLLAQTIAQTDILASTLSGGANSNSGKPAVATAIGSKGPITSPPHTPVLSAGTNSSMMSAAKDGGVSLPPPILTSHGQSHSAHIILSSPTPNSSTISSINNTSSVTPVITTRNMNSILSGQNAGNSSSQYLPSYAFEINTNAKELAKEFEYKDAMQCLELFQYKKFTLSIRESCQIEKDQLAILRQHLANGGDSLDQHQASYTFDYMKPSTRWALAELAKTVQHIANISCLPKEEMQAFARESLVRQNIAIGAQDKESYESHVFTGYENNTINTQTYLATRIKEVYEKFGQLPPGNW